MLLSLLLAQIPLFSEPIAVANSARLALTPVLDGKIEAEEWDAFGPDSYFQWQPGQLHFAVKIPKDRVLVASFDLQGNGWLVGKDNLEVRAVWTEKGAEFSTRLLDCTRVGGPVWENSPSFLMASRFSEGTDGEMTVIEATISDPGTGLIPSSPSKGIGVRFDSLSGEATYEPYLPRVMTQAELVTERAANLPSGLIFSPEGAGRVSVPGGSAKIRLTFKGNDQIGLKRIEMRGEGFAQQATQSGGKPFPDFDKKGRAYVDYETDIAKDASIGYRVMRASLTDAAGSMATLQTSYFIAPILTFEMGSDKPLKSQDEPRTVRFGATLRSNTSKRLDGIFNAQPPEGWKVEKGNGKSFIIYNPRGAKRQVFEVTIPGGYKGTAPIKLTADIGSKKVEQVAWITIE